MVRREAVLIILVPSAFGLHVLLSFLLKSSQVDMGGIRGSLEPLSHLLVTIHI